MLVHVQLRPWSKSVVIISFVAGALGLFTVDSSYDPISVYASPLMTWKFIYRDLDHAERFDWLYRDQMLWGSAGLAVGQANRPTSYARCLPGLRVDCYEITWGSEEEI